jgi:hypothetical protein
MRRTLEIFPRAHVLHDGGDDAGWPIVRSYGAKFTRSRSPKPVDRDRRKRSMAITETGPSRSVVRPVPSRSRADPRVIRGWLQP